MPVIFIILVVLCVFLLLRIGIVVEYGSEGVSAFAKIAFLHIRLYPPKRAEKKRRSKKGKEKETGEKDEEGKKGGRVGKFREWLDVIGRTFSKIRRRLRIKNLTLHYTAAAESAASAALLYGGANAAMAVLLPIMEENFRIKNRDIRIDVDFDKKENAIYGKGDISIAIWEIIYIAAAFGYNIITGGLLKNGKKEEKGGT